MNQHFRILFVVYAIFTCSISLAQTDDNAGGILLTEVEVRKLFPEEVLKQIGIQFPIFKVYSFEDKNGKQYLIFTENVVDDGAQEEISLKKSIKAFNVYFQESKDVKVRWTITDFIDENEKSIWFWTRYLNLKDLDDDGFIDPIIVYGTKSIYGEDFEEGRVKILIYYLEKKIAIRHQNSELDDGRHTQIDQRFYCLPFEIKKKTYDIVVFLESNGHSLFNTELKNKITKSLRK